MEYPNNWSSLGEHITSNSYIITTSDGTGNRPYDMLDGSGMIRDDHSLNLNLSKGTIKVGQLVMGAQELELCLRTLLEMTKERKPEEFI